MRKIYILLRNLKPLVELLTKMPFVPAKDVLTNVVLQEKLRQKLSEIRKKEFGD